MASDKVKTFDSTNFQSDVLESDKPVVVDFWAEWCGPCRMIAPIIEEIAEAHPEIVVGKLDIEDARDVAMRYGIASIPFVAKFENGVMTKQAIGAQPRAAFEQKLAL